MKSIIFIINLLITVSLFSADFMAQEDYYFGRSKTDIQWSIASGLSFGKANGYLGMSDGMNVDLEVMRIMLRISPAYLHIDHIWLSSSVGITEYDTGSVIHKIFSPQWTLGFALKLSEQGFFQNLYPYFGGGYGIADYSVKSLSPDSNSDNNEDDSDDSSQSDTVFIQLAGLEYSITSMISVCLEERFIWGTYTRRNNYLPADYDDSEKPSPQQLGEENKNKTFRQDEVDVNQITLRAGIRIYWGLNLFD